jgi:hypothetical protein
MAKEIGTIRPGTSIKVQAGDRIRHAIVTEVTDQDSVAVRIGGAGNPTSTIGLDVERVEATKTRGTIFRELDD